MTGPAEPATSFLPVLPPTNKKIVCQAVADAVNHVNSCHQILVLGTQPNAKNGGGFSAVPLPGREADLERHDSSSHVIHLRIASLDEAETQAASKGGAFSLRPHLGLIR